MLVTRPLRPSILAKMVPGLRGATNSARPVASVVTLSPLEKATVHARSQSAGNVENRQGGALTSDKLVRQEQDARARGSRSLLGSHDARLRSRKTQAQTAHGSNGREKERTKGL